MTIQLEKYTERLKYADNLIHLEATGKPKDFARKLNISESHLYNILEDLRFLGMPLAYSKSNLTYYYTKPVQLHIEIVVMPLNNNEAEKICGGRNIMLNLIHYNFIRV